MERFTQQFSQCSRTSSSETRKVVITSQSNMDGRFMTGNLDQQFNQMIENSSGGFKLGNLEGFTCEMQNKIQQFLNDNGGEDDDENVVSKECDAESQDQCAENEGSSFTRRAVEAMNYYRKMHHAPPLVEDATINK
ncbi:unnamed protein product [Enterobius vermicularis]|uniref:SCP domain-containing protein n=1 Tax=Enterobius vermicularis TaxID=51028 RepID=A0A0N4V3C5_ENTVE|nr:unnamed protein product [Enterobius vermicularis]